MKYFLIFNLNKANVRYGEDVESVREDIKCLFFDIFLMWSKLWDFKENKMNPIKHYATFANVKLVNVTF